MINQGTGVYLNEVSKPVKQLLYMKQGDTSGERLERKTECKREEDIER